MKRIFSWLKNRVSSEGDYETDYLDLEPEGDSSKINVKIFSLNAFDDVKTVIEEIREGSTVALISIKDLKDKDVFELRRAINSLKRTCNAIGGDIAGLSEEWVVATPGFAQIHRDQLNQSNLL